MCCATIFCEFGRLVTESGFTLLSLLALQPICIASGNKNSIHAPNPFALSNQIKASFKTKDFQIIERLLSSEATITESEFLNFYVKNASFGDKKSPTLAKLIIDSDQVYIEAGMRHDGEVSGIIYFITAPEIQRRRQWLRDYAACAFTSIDGNLMLRNGFCFIGTDGAPELDPVQRELFPKGYTEEK